MERRTFSAWLAALPLAFFLRSKRAHAKATVKDEGLFRIVTITIQVTDADVDTQWVHATPSFVVPDAPVMRKFADAVQSAVLQHGHPVFGENVRLDLLDADGKPWAADEGSAPERVEFRPYDYFDLNGSGIKRPALILRAIDLRRFAWRKSSGQTVPPKPLRSIVAYFTVCP